MLRNMLYVLLFIAVYHWLQYRANMLQMFSRCLVETLTSNIWNVGRCLVVICQMFAKHLLNTWNPNICQTFNTQNIWYNLVLHKDIHVYWIHNVCLLILANHVYAPPLRFRLDMSTPLSVRTICPSPSPHSDNHPRPRLPYFEVDPSSLSKNLLYN